MAIRVARFLDVAEGTQANQFSVGSHDEVNSLDDLDPIYKQLLDSPIHCTMGLIGNDGLVNMTPMWFDYEGDKVLCNLAAQRKKIEWIRRDGKISLLIVNPENMYHWISFKCTVAQEIHEDDPAEGYRATEHVNKIWRKYIGDGDTYALRDPSFDEKRVLVICNVDRIATFGKP